MSAYRMLLRARFVKSWGQYDAGLVTRVLSLEEALAMVPAEEFQEIDRFYFVPLEEPLLS